MKKHIVAILTAVLLLSSLLTGCDFTLIDNHDNEPQPEQAVIKELSGDVTSAKADGKPNNPADKGVILWTDYTLHTGADSWAKLEVGEGRYLLAEGNTDIKVLSLPDGDNKLTSVEISGGKVWVNIELELSEDEDFIVRTEGCAMSAKGTIFSVLADGKETGLTVYEGTVNMLAQDSDGTAIPDANGGETNYAISNGSWAMTVENGVVSEQYGGILDEEAIAPLNADNSGGINGAIQAIAPGLLWSSSGSGGDSPIFTLYPGRVEMSPGAAVPLYAAPSTGVTWSSSHPDVASVDSKGIVTAGVEGDAIITAKRGPQSVYCRIVVIEGSPTLLYVSDFDWGGGSGGGTGPGDDDGGGDDTPSDTAPEPEPFDPNSIPVEWVPELDIPIEQIPKVRGYVWTIRIKDMVTKPVAVSGGPPVDVTTALDYVAVKDGGMNCRGDFQSQKFEWMLMAQEDMSSEIIARFTVAGRATAQPFKLPVKEFPGGGGIGSVESLAINSSASASYQVDDQSGTPFSGDGSGTTKFTCQIQPNGLATARLYAQGTVHVYKGWLYRKPIII